MARTSRSRTPHALPLAALGRHGRVCLGERAGVVAHDVPDADDFVLTTDQGGPDWHLRRWSTRSSPTASPPAASPPRRPRGRSARLGRAADRPRAGDATASSSAATSPVSRRGSTTSRSSARTSLYLTPFFPAGSTHRYDATSFERVDPLLGGDEALASLVAAAHARGMRVLGDVTSNHCGSATSGSSARADPTRRSAATTTSTRRSPAATRPGSASSRSRARLALAGAARAHEAVRAAGWPTYGLDGWRIDVANMAGRHRDLDLTARRPRDPQRSVGPTACSSPSTATTSGTTSSAAAGTG